jgi:hypothetical protein
MPGVENWNDYFIKLVPDHLRDEWGRRWWGAISAQTDLLAEGAAQALRAGWLNGEILPRDVLELCGRDKGLPQYPGETQEDYQARLLQAWDIWPLAGTAACIETNLRAAGFTDATVVWFPARPGPKGETGYWSQFWISIPETALNLVEPRWGQMVYGCFWWGYGALTLADATLFWTIVRKFKPADHICRGIELV